MAGYLAELLPHPRRARPGLPGEPGRTLPRHGQRCRRQVHRWGAGRRPHVPVYGACRPVPKIFTCDECIEGMEWIEAYLEDPIFQVEAALFLEQHWCTPERPQCIPAIQHHFVPMHVMVMERFMVPTDICNHQFAACNPDWTTHPHPTEGPQPTPPHPTHPPM